MNNNQLIGLALLAGAALWYVSREEEEKEEVKEEVKETALKLQESAQEAAEAAQEAVEQIQEDLPAVEEQVLKALEGLEEAINLQLTEAPLGALWNPSPLTMNTSRQTIIQEIRSGQATMTTDRIGRRLYEVIITRPDGVVLTVRAKVIPTPSGPKVVLFKPGEGFKAAVKVKRERRKAIQKQAMTKRRTRRPVRRAVTSYQVPMAVHEAEEAKHRAKGAARTKRMQALLGGESGEIGRSILLMIAIRQPRWRRRVEAHLVRHALKHGGSVEGVEEHVDKMAAAAQGEETRKMVRQFFLSPGFKAALAGQTLRHWIRNNLIPSIKESEEEEGDPPITAAEEPELVAELEALLAEEGIPLDDPNLTEITLSSSYAGLISEGIPNFGYLDL